MKGSRLSTARLSVPRRSFIKCAVLACVGGAIDRAQLYAQSPQGLEYTATSGRPESLYQNVFNTLQTWSLNREEILAVPNMHPSPDMPAPHRNAFIDVFHLWPAATV